MSSQLPGSPVAVVTGAGSGLGRASARALAQAGAQLVLLDRDAAGLAAVAKDLGAVAHVVDVTDAAAVGAVFAGLGRCDILVNSAGVEGPRGGLETCDPADLHRVMQVNLFGGLHCVQAALPGMSAGGAIVNIASTAGMVGSGRLGAYGVSKAAVVSMTRSLAITLAPQGIRVNAVCPGSIDSPMFDRTLDGASAAADRAHMVAIHPLGRLGLPEEVAAAVVYLASPAASYCTGVMLPVDGGRLA